MRVCAIQMPHGPTLDENLARAGAALALAAEGGAKLALLPEYFFATFPGGPPAAASQAPRIRERMRDASARLGIAVAGNVIEPLGAGFSNVGVVYEDGALAMEQAKIHPMPREAGAGVVGGASLSARPVLGHSTGMLVCADILYPEASRILSLQGAEVLLNPVMSPWREEDDGREARVAMYVARAYDSGAFVLKAAGYLRGAPRSAKREGADASADASSAPAIAGRSLITAPWGVLARAKDDFAEEHLYADLDFDRLRAFREKQAHFPARRPEAYGGLL